MNQRRARHTQLVAGLLVVGGRQPTCRRPTIEQFQEGHLRRDTTQVVDLRRSFSSPLSAQSQTGCVVLDAVGYAMARPYAVTQLTM